MIINRIVHHHISFSHFKIITSKFVRITQNSTEAPSSAAGIINKSSSLNVKYLSQRLTPLNLYNFPCHAACDAGQYTPAVISVVYYSCTIGVNQSCDRQLAVTYIIVIRTLITDSHQLAAAVIQVMLPYAVLLLRQDTAARCQVFCCDTVYFLGCPDAGCIIRICVYSLFFLLFLLFCHI